MLGSTALRSLGHAPPAGALARALAAALALTACGELKTASPLDDDTGEAGAPASSGSASSSGSVGSSGSSGNAGSSGSAGDDASAVPVEEPLPPGTGPGAAGSLPSGYCCTDDAQCRYRHCAAVGSGGRMCLDICRGPSSCTRRDLAFACNAPTAWDDGHCEPKTPDFACIPQAKFERGTRAVGECCEATGDGNAGEECDGNRCDSYGLAGQNNPFVCSRWCSITKDCPSGTVCRMNSCLPGNLPYTCN